ncbi:porin [Paraburkholderia fungorum]|uniref:porin n=1 Tax=Paraburkholderia fungorum TaxID=134537 RepID=UPI0038BA322B
MNNIAKLGSYAAGMVMLLTAGQALAQSSVQLYGLIDVYAGAQRALGGQTAAAMNSGGMTTSYWGIRGTEALGSGYSVLFELEAFMRPAIGAGGRSATDPFFGRNAYVGFGTPYGQFLVGRNTTPYYISELNFNSFGASFGFSPVIVQTYKGLLGQGVVGDNDWNNSVLYNASVGDVTGSLIYGTANTPGHFGQNQWGGNLLYSHGPFGMTLAFQQVRYNETAFDLTTEIPGFSKQTALFTAASYDLKVAKFTASYQRVADTISTGDLTTQSGQIGVSVPLGSGYALASYMFAKTAGGVDPIRVTYSLGYDYLLSKRTDVYAVWMNDRATGYSSALNAGIGIRTRF